VISGPRRLVAVAALAGALFAAPGAARAAAPRILDLAWVGDMAFDARAGLPAGGALGALTPVAPGLRSDLTMGNLEGTLGASGTTKCHGAGDCYAFQAPASYAAQFRRLGFGVLNQANNHANDAGPAGRRATAAALRRAGIAVAGSGTRVVRLRVRHTRVAVLGFAPYAWSASLLDIAAARRLVRAAARRAGVVVVIVHAGAEGADRAHVPHGEEHAFGEDRGDVRRFAHAVVDAGADVVLGSGPHVLRGLEDYRGRLIAYSLGDFAGDRTLSIAGRCALSGILHVAVTPDGQFAGGRWWPVRLVRPGLPRLDPTRASAAFVNALSRADFGRDRVTISAAGHLRARDMAQEIRKLRP
jgi:poly-gamma-glutamate capsule biosynthesis protein CapA/YwtB (metallophosphatase superfamily)